MEERQERTLLTLSVAHLLVQNGWTPGEYKRTDHSGRTAYCLVGALDEAAEGLELGVRQSRRAAQAIMCALGKHCPGLLPRQRLISWNGKRHKRDVLAVLAKTICLCAAEAGYSRSRSRSRPSRRPEPGWPLPA
jgi:hypothetical protein